MSAAERLPERVRPVDLVAIHECECCGFVPRSAVTLEGAVLCPACAGDRAIQIAEANTRTPRQLREGAEALAALAVEMRLEAMKQERRGSKLEILGVRP